MRERSAVTRQDRTNQPIPRVTSRSVPFHDHPRRRILTLPILPPPFLPRTDLLQPNVPEPPSGQLPTIEIVGLQL